MGPAAEGAPSSDPAGYPRDFETDVVLADGATAHVRPIRPDDGPRIVAFHARQSPRSIYFRFFSPRPRLSDREVAQMTHVDYIDRMALVAVRDEELLGVARYDRWRHRSEAEVAFFVDDANHGRGLATVLLEHLAVRARDVGLTGFTASVLPENRKMIGVFTQAGFESATRFADGVIEVQLALTPTPEAEAAIEARARRAASQAVRRLLSPRSVAVIGAGRTPGTIGHDIVRNLQRAGFEGPVWPVNTKAEHVASMRAVASILDIPDDVDLAVIAVPAPSVPAVVEECGRKQVYGVVIESAGFAESGPAGAALEAEVLRIARSWGIRVVGPNCLGIINTDPAVRLHATFAHAVPLRGRVALLSESGMVGAAIVSQAREEGIGISSFVALGNRCDVSGNDLLQYWESDEHTDVVCMYIESFGNARHFSRLARRLSRAKPVVAVKAGRTSDAGPAGVWGASDDALLRQTGVIRVPSLPAMLDTARLLVHQPLPGGRRIAVLGNASGSLAIAADAAAASGLELAALDEGTRSSLRSLAPYPITSDNPVDLGVQADAPTFALATSLLAQDPSVDAILVVYAPSLGGPPAHTLAALHDVHQRHPDVPLVACSYGGRDGLPVDPDGAVPVYGAVDAAARALGWVADYATWLDREDGEPLALTTDALHAAHGLVGAALDAGATALDVTGARDLLRTVGIESVPTSEVDGVDAAVAAAAVMGYPVALKAACRDALAKTVVAGLALDLSDEEGLRSAWARMHERLGDEMLPALVQTMVEPGVDAAVEVADHPEVGPVLSLRPGGANAALDRAADLRVLPLGVLEATRLVAGSRLGPYLDADGAARLEALLLRLGALVEEVPEVARVALNPVVVGPDGAIPIDVEIALREVSRDPAPQVRRI